MTYFTNGLDPMPRSRQVFNFHRPETLAEWVAQPAQLRARLQAAAAARRGAACGRSRRRPSATSKQSLAEADPRALIQMATGSGKTFTAVNVAYRLVKFAGAKRILFLVDRGNLGKQTLKTSSSQLRRRPTTGASSPSSTTSSASQRTRSTRPPRSSSPPSSASTRCSRARPSSTPSNEEGSAFDAAKPWQGEPPDVVYNAGIPPEFFDFIIVDECHRSIYDLWRQVLEYFDAFLDRPHRHARQADLRLLQPEPRHGVRPRARPSPTASTSTSTSTASAPSITEQGATIDADDTGVYVDKRHKRTRARAAGEARRGPHLHRQPSSTATSSSESQIRTVLAARSATSCFTEIFPGRTEVPKTLIFAKDDSHADDIVRIVPRGVRRGQRLLPEDHLPHRLHQGHEEGQERRRHRVGSHRVGEDLQPHARRDPRQLPQQLQPAHRRHRGHDRHRHRREAARVRVLHAQREVGRTSSSR